MISVEAAGLAWLRTECDRLAGTVISPAPAFSGGFQATSEAVHAIHGEVDGAARRIADRLRSTGEKVSHAGGRFEATEAVNEAVVREV